MRRINDLIQPLPVLTQQEPSARDKEGKDNDTVLSSHITSPDAHQAALCIFPTHLFHQKAGPATLDVEYDYDLQAAFKDMKLEDKQQTRENAMDLESEIPDEQKLADLIDQRIAALGLSGKSNNHSHPQRDSKKQNPKPRTSGRRTNSHGKRDQRLHADDNEQPRGRGRDNGKNRDNGRGAREHKTTSTTTAKGNNNPSRPSTHRRNNPSRPSTHQRNNRRNNHRSRTNSTASQQRGRDQTRNSHNPQPRRRSLSSSFFGEGAPPRPPNRGNRNTNSANSHQNKRKQLSDLSTRNAKGRKAESAN